MPTEVLRTDTKDDQGQFSPFLNEANFQWWSSVFRKV